MQQDVTLLIDLGNSRGKWLVLTGSQISHRGHSSIDSLMDDLPADLGGARALVASVASSTVNKTLGAALAARGLNPWFAGSQASLGGLVNSYDQPERMGVDRWLAMLAARTRCDRRLCVVDAGSALTIDLVADDGHHEGGYIIPGSALMERSLFADTERVRFDMPVDALLAPGRSTAEAVGHGLLLAQIGAVRTAMAEAERRGPAPALFLCGGGAEQFAGDLDLAYEFAPDLVLEGLLRQAVLLGVVSDSVSML